MDRDALNGISTQRPLFSLSPNNIFVVSTRCDQSKLQLNVSRERTCMLCAVRQLFFVYKRLRTWEKSHGLEEMLQRRTTYCFDQPNEKKRAKTNSSIINSFAAAVTLRYKTEWLVYALHLIDSFQTLDFHIGIWSDIKQIFSSRSTHTNGIAVEQL